MVRNRNQHKSEYEDSARNFTLGVLFLVFIASMASFSKTPPHRTYNSLLPPKANSIDTSNHGQSVASIQTYDADPSKYQPPRPVYSYVPSQQYLPQALVNSYVDKDEESDDNGDTESSLQYDETDPYADNDISSDAFVEQAARQQPTQYQWPSINTDSSPSRVYGSDQSNTYAKNNSIWNRDTRNYRRYDSWPQQPQQGSTYDWQSGNSYSWYKYSDGSTHISGSNINTGSYWNQDIKPDGSMHGFDKNSNYWTYDAGTGYYSNLGTGETCYGKGEFRQCYGGTSSGN